MRKDWRIHLRKSNYPQDYMALKIRNGPQSCAPLQWAEGKKTPTASRHQGCLTKVPKSLKKTREFNVGTWNVNTMRDRGKPMNVIREMKRMGLNVMGLSEVRWKEAGDFESEDIRVIHPGSKGIGMEKHFY